MKGISDEEIDKVLQVVEKNPEIFSKIASEVDILIKSGKDQRAASMEVMEKYQSELKNIKM